MGQTVIMDSQSRAQSFWSILAKYLLMINHQTNPSGGMFYKIADKYPSRGQGHER